jgi:hypothetical protein
VTGATGHHDYSLAGRFTTDELHAHGEQRADYLGDTAMDGVQRELPTVHAEQQVRGRAGEPHAPERRYRVDLATDELEQIKRDLQTTLAFMRADSQARIPVLTYIQTIDAELEARTRGLRRDGCTYWSGTRRAE